MVWAKADLMGILSTITTIFNFGKRQSSTFLKFSSQTLHLCFGLSERQSQEQRIYSSALWRTTHAYIYTYVYVVVLIV